MDKLNEIRIDVPEGTEAYLENNIIKFRPIKKELTYDDIAKELFYGKSSYFIREGKDINRIENYIPFDTYIYSNNSTSKKQAEKLIAINKLMNVAKYFNGDWRPDWNNDKEYKYYLRICNKIINIGYANIYISNIVYFKSEELAKQAIEILGKETIKLALCTDW